MAYVTVNFSWAEFDCHDGTPVPENLRPNTRRLCSALEKVRDAFGGPLVVISGYRTSAYNKRVGGAKHSRHVQADAADIRPVTMADLPLVKAAVERVLASGQAPEIGGYGVYPRWVHIDTRPRAADGHVARWGGTGQGSEQ